MEKGNIDKKQKNYWFGVSAFLFLIIMVLSIVMGVVGLDINKGTDKDGTETIDPIIPETGEVRDGTYGYISYYDGDGMYTNDVTARSLFKTIDLIEIAPGTTSVSELKIQTKPLSEEEEEKLLEVGIIATEGEAEEATPKNGLNLTTIKWTDGEIVDESDIDSSTFEDFVKHFFIGKLHVGVEDGYIDSSISDSDNVEHAGKNRFNAWLGGGYAGTAEYLKDEFFGFYIDIIDPDEHYNSTTGEHNAILLFNFELGVKEYSSAKLGATITATMIFDGKIEDTWNEIVEAKGVIEDTTLWDMQTNELISFYVDNNGQAELYDENDNVIVKGDFDFLEVEPTGLVIDILKTYIESGKIDKDAILAYLSSEDFEIEGLTAQLHSLIKAHAKIGFKIDDETNSQEDLKNQDYMIDLDLGVGLKIKTYNRKIGVLIDLDASLYKVPKLDI